MLYAQWTKLLKRALWLSGGMGVSVVILRTSYGVKEIDWLTAVVYAMAAFVTGMTALVMSLRTDEETANG